VQRARFGTQLVVKHVSQSVVAEPFTHWAAQLVAVQAVKVPKQSAHPVEMLVRLPSKQLAITVPLPIA